MSKYRGSVVLLNFWASWCAPCQLEMPGLERLHARLKDRGLVVLAVGVDDTVENLDKFRKEYGLTFPLAHDDAGEARALYKLTGFPETFVIDRAGRVTMVPDPVDDLPVVRIVGPREWDSPEAISMLSEVLGRK